MIHAIRSIWFIRGKMRCGGFLPRRNMTQSWVMWFVGLPTWGKLFVWFLPGGNVCCCVPPWDKLDLLDFSTGEIKCVVPLPWINLLYVWIRCCFILLPGRHVISWISKTDKWDLLDAFWGQASLGFIHVRNCFFFMLSPSDKFEVFGFPIGVIFLIC